MLAIKGELADIQHDHNAEILSAVHVHLDHHNCLEVLIVRGRACVKPGRDGLPLGDSLTASA